MDRRRRYRELAELERRAAQRSADVRSCRAHIDKAREYDWLAEAEPKLDGPAALETPSA